MVIHETDANTTVQWLAENVLSGIAKEMEASKAKEPEKTKEPEKAK